MWVYEWTIPVWVCLLSRTIKASPDSRRAGSTAYCVRPFWSAFLNCRCVLGILWSFLEASGGHLIYQDGSCNTKFSVPSCYYLEVRPWTNGLPHEVFLSPCDDWCCLSSISQSCPTTHGGGNKRLQVSGSSQSCWGGLKPTETGACQKCFCGNKEILF